MAKKVQGISRRALAEKLSVSERTLANWDNNGWVVRYLDHSINEDATLAMVARNRDTAKGRTKPLPLDVHPGLLDGGELADDATMDEARRRAAIEGARLAELKRRKTEGELVSRAAVERTFFQEARRLRDAIEGVPARHAAELAARFGADPHTVEQALMKILAEVLADISRASCDV
jgi:phage terminase Nu1 subunit (DNA packaging protein)